MPRQKEGVALQNEYPFIPQRNPSGKPQIPGPISPPDAQSLFFMETVSFHCK